jgi:hypothetical protein
MSDEVGKEISQNAEKRQSRNAVCRKNPSAAAFMMPDVSGRGRRLLRNRRRYCWGPIFHTRKPPNGKIVAQVLYASRLPGVLARQDYLRGILLRFWDHRYKEM